MNSLEQLNRWVAAVERRLRWRTFSRGAAITAVAALAATLALVVVAGRYGFSENSLVISRFLLFLSLALAAGFGLVWPSLRLSRRLAARRAEARVPEFEQRLLTLVERQQHGPDPFLELLAGDAAEVARRAEPARVAGGKWSVAFASLAAASVGTLVWLILAGPGVLGYGSALLWAGAPPGAAESFFRIHVQPGNVKVRRGSDLTVSAQLIGFQAQPVTLHARYKSSSRWEGAPMQPAPGSAGAQFLFAGLTEPVEYYVSAGPVRTELFRVEVADLPNVRNIRVTYHFPKWLGLPASVEDPGGDLRAIEGTQAELTITTDSPLANGVIVLEDGRRIPLRTGLLSGNVSSASVPVERDGVYYIAALEDGEPVRISQDYFIEAQKEHEPLVRIRRPGRDARVSPIEEVTIEVEAEDDFALKGLELRYSVNGSQERTAPLLPRPGAKSATASTTLFLEDFGLVPGDVVAFYAVAADARRSTQTDIYFLEAQPFERHFTQSQQMGGMQGEGGAREDEISRRQKEIIAATWNLVRDRTKTAAERAADGKYLADVQNKLREQAETLARRMRSRELAQASQELQSFARDMEQSAKAMAEAAEQLQSARWQQALVPEQRALQHLLRAEATRRQIQVAFGRQAGGGGSGGGGRDLESLFDLELDTEKNQYETGQSLASSQQRNREIDEALERLEQLARRQQELAERHQRNPGPSFEQRWQQEMLRREAEQLRQRMEQLARGSSTQPSGAQSRQVGGTQSAASSQTSQERQSEARRSADRTARNVDPRLDRALEQLRRATEDMRSSASPAGASNGQSSAASRRAAERLNEATRTLSGLRQQEASAQLDALLQEAERLAAAQRDFERRMRREFANQPPGAPQSAEARQRARAMAEEKDRMHEALTALEQDIQRTSRDLAGTQRPASSRLREAVGDLQKDQITLAMKLMAEWLRRGMGAYAWTREPQITEGLERLRAHLAGARRALNQTLSAANPTEGALDRVEQLRSRLQDLTRQNGEETLSGQQPPRQNSTDGRPGDPNLQRAARQNQPGGASRSGDQAGRSLANGQYQPQAQAGPNGGRNPQDAEGNARADSRRQAGGAVSGLRDDWDASNTGNRAAPQWDGRLSGADLRELERTYRDGLRDLGELRRTLGQEDPEALKELEALIRQMQSIDPSRFPGNPELVDRLRTQVLPSLEQVELRLRRKVEDQKGVVRSGSREQPPPGYAEAVAEYFRRLSRGAR